MDKRQPPSQSPASASVTVSSNLNRQRGWLEPSARLFLAAIFIPLVVAVDLGMQFYHVYSAPPPSAIYSEFQRILVVMGENYWLPVDFHGQYFTIEHGIRRTVGQPTHYAHTVWVFGNSSTFDLYVDDAHTMTSQLQALLPTSRVINMSAASYRISAEVARLRDTPVRAGDLVIFLDGAADGKDALADGALVDHARRFKVLSAQAQSWARQHGAIFYHVTQPYIDDSMAPFYALLDSPRISVPSALFVETSHLNANGDALVAAAVYDALTLI